MTPTSATNRIMNPSLVRYAVYQCLSVGPVLCVTWRIKALKAHKTHSKQPTLRIVSNLYRPTRPDATRRSSRVASRRVGRRKLNSRRIPTVADRNFENRYFRVFTLQTPRDDSDPWADFQTVDDIAALLPLTVADSLHTDRCDATVLSRRIGWLNWAKLAN